MRQALDIILLFRAGMVNNIFNMRKTQLNYNLISHVPNRIPVNLIFTTHISIYHGNSHKHRYGNKSGTELASRSFEPDSPNRVSLEINKSGI